MGVHKKEVRQTSHKRYIRRGIRSNLAREIAKQTNLPLTDVATIIPYITKGIFAALAEGTVVSLDGVGVFYFKKWSARKNLKIAGDSREMVDRFESYYLEFLPTLKLKKAINKLKQVKSFDEIYAHTK